MEPEREGERKRGGQREEERIFVCAGVGVLHCHHQAYAAATITTHTPSSGRSQLRCTGRLCSAAAGYPLTWKLLSSGIPAAV